MRLDNFLLRTLRNVPKSRIYRIIRSGEVRVNSGRAKPGTRLAAADEIRLPPVRQRPKTDPGRPPDGLIDRVKAAIVTEHPDFILFNKPPGLAVHAGSSLRFGLIEILRAARPDEYLELVHRIDRQTSGALLVARSRPALDELRAALSAVDARKRYLALVDGVWPHGAVEVDVPLSRDAERGGERMVVVDREAGKASLSYFTPIERFERASLMQVEIATGRTHQIRVHAAHMGYPLAGDDKYGANAAAKAWRAAGLERMFLHAGELRIGYADAEHHLKAPLAADLQPVLNRLRTAT